MPCGSDTGATAPISALTYAFSIDSNRGQLTDDSALRIIDLAVPALSLVVTQSDDKRGAWTTTKRRPLWRATCHSE